MADESHVTLKSLPAPPICSKEATYPGHMLNRFLCDSYIPFSCGSHKNFVIVLSEFVKQSPASSDENLFL